MSWLPRCLAAALLAGLLATLIVVAQPSPPPARANPICDVGSAPAGVVTGGVGAITGGLVGGGNPVGDACNAVSDEVTGAVTAPISDALKGVGNGIFEQITTWVADGASWLIGQVVKGIEETTTTQLTTKGFVSQYGRMAEIAALMGLAMLLLAVLEGLAQGNAGLLARVVLINLPLAFIATSVAYAVVQLLLVATDGMCHAIASASHDNSEQFFKGAITGLGEAGGSAGKEVGGAGGTNPSGAAAGEAAGSVGVPLFVTFLAAIIGAFAAFLVWLELLMRDAAIYVVALFMPHGPGGVDLAALDRRSAPHRRAARGRHRLEVRHRLDHLAGGRPGRRDRWPSRAHPRRLGADAARLLRPVRAAQARAVRRGRDDRRLRSPLCGGRRGERGADRKRRADPPQHGPLQLGRVGRDALERGRERWRQRRTRARWPTRRRWAGCGIGGRWWRGGRCSRLVRRPRAEPGLAGAAAAVPAAAVRGTQAAAQRLQGTAVAQETGGSAGASARAGRRGDRGARRGDAP